MCSRQIEIILAMGRCGVDETGTGVGGQRSAKELKQSLPLLLAGQQAFLVIADIGGESLLHGFEAWLNNVVRGELLLDLAQFGYFVWSE